MECFPQLDLGVRIKKFRSRPPKAFTKAFSRFLEKHPSPVVSFNAANSRP